MIGEVDMFVGPNYVLSVRNRSAQGFLGVRAALRARADLLKQGPAFVLYALMDAVVDRYFPIVDAFETRAGADRGAHLRQRPAARARTSRGCTR